MINRYNRYNRYKNNYRFRKPPVSIFKAALDNIAIVPASLLPFKDSWQKVANNLPKGSILICHSSGNIKQKTILQNVGSLFQQKGHNVKSISIDESMLQTQL